MLSSPLFAAGIQFDGTVTLGTLLQIVALAATIFFAVQAVKNRLELFETTLKAHAEALKKHDGMLGTYEGRVFDLVGSLQRLIGRFETLEHMQHRE